MIGFSADIIEIFSSIQGEGPYLGQKQIFVRFSGCNLSCKYCDTDSNTREYCKIYDKPDNFRKIKNPVYYRCLAEEISKLNPKIHHSISFTGGEPLLQAEFLRNFLKDFKKEIPGIKIYLETNGTLAEEMKLTVNYIDIISMDIKLKSSTHEPVPFRDHAEFIRVLRGFSGDFFVKIVINQHITQNEISLVKELLKTSGRDIKLVLQPESNRHPGEKLLSVQNEFLKDIKDVRVIAQMHKYLNLR